MSLGDPLPFAVYLWTEDGLRIEAIVAQCATLSVARAAFDIAAMSYPQRFVSLNGPGATEIHAPRLPWREVRSGRGVTTDPERMNQNHHVV